MIGWINKYLSKNYLPRWLIFAFDLSVIIISLFIAHLLINRLQISLVNWNIVFWQTAVIIPVYSVNFIIFRPFAEVLRRSTLEDILVIFYSITLAVFSLIIINTFVSETSPVYFPLSIVVLQSGISMVIMVISRVFIQTFYHIFFQTKQVTRKVIIYGAGSLGQTALNAIMKDNESSCKVIAFIDDNTSLQFKRLTGGPIYSSERVFR